MSRTDQSLSVLINEIDYTLAPPGSLDSSFLPRVPVIRIYGASSAGKKACVHVHQVYPYFFIEYTAKVIPDDVNQYITKLSSSLDHAIALSLKRNPSSSGSHIRAILLVKGVHFYGFHSSYTPFLKIYLADPALMSRAVALMQSGTIMRTKFHVFESHLSYLLQFMCDFGLYGCGWIDLGEVWQRSPEEQDVTSANFKPSPYYRQSRMSIEFDVVAHQILNRYQLQARDVHHKLTIPAPPLPSEPVVLSVRELWEDERRRRINKGLTPTPMLPVDLSKSSRSRGGDWVAEARWWEELKKNIQAEKQNPLLILETHDWEKWVMSTFESIEALWEPQQKTWKPGGNDADELKAHENRVLPSDEAENPFSQTSQGAMNDTREGIEPEVDEMMLSSQNIDQAMACNEKGWLEDVGENEDVDDNIDDGHYQDDQDSRPERESEIESGHEDPRAITPTPFENNGETSAVPNLFLDAWKKLSRGKRSRSPLESPTNGETTPTKALKRPRQQLVMPDVMTRPDFLVPPVDASSQDSLPYSGGNQKQVNTAPSSPLDFATKAVETPVDLMSAERASANTLIPRASYSSSSQSFHFALKKNAFVYVRPPPLPSDLLSTTESYGLPSKPYRDPFYSKKDDVPARRREYAGLVFHLKGGGGLDTLTEWENLKGSMAPLATNRQLSASSGGWEYAGWPPNKQQVMRWLTLNPPWTAKKPEMRSQIEGRTPSSLDELKLVPAKKSTSDFFRVGQHMTLLSMEVFAPSRQNRLADVNIDEMAAIFYAFGEDDPNSGRPDQGVLILESKQPRLQHLRGVPMEVLATELELINRFIDIVIDLDPDIVLGWEVQAASWGYLWARGNHYGLDVAEQISRAPSRNSRNDNEQWSQRSTTTFKVTGRHVFNVWRIMRSEQTLNTYTFENVVFHLLRRRSPRYKPFTLTEWFNGPIPALFSRALHYFLERTLLNLEILKAAETTTKTAEFARVFGVDFYSVISRGSQFKVESFMFRIAKPECFVLLSPNRLDVGKQNAAECMPLVMEPLSAFYNGPLVVLDFQSLYPSIMIAYNYCYSTCLGRITDFQGRNKFGVTDLQRPPGLIEKLRDHIAIAPNGIMYVKPIVRQGLLGRMLTELLDTRVMVKQAMKNVKDDKVLSRILDARQLGLKYIANVTYGYTSATYSGRMPAVEIADSIVQSGRETLEKAINIIDSTEKWGARVVYGDTDSLFIYLKDKTKEQAFKIGQNIADTITAMNPPPMKLKFEKVYLPCVLLAKKRYVGFKFESPDDEIPTFDAKGIETVRRDGVAAQSKMTETCLKILFRTQDLSKVKEYCCRTWSKILRNKASIQDFIFAKEVKMGTYSEKGPPPPGATVAARRMLEDPNDEPQYGERVPYIITRGDPHTRLVERAMTPEELLTNFYARIDGIYYIERVLIPPLERIFNLLGADVRAWYEDMPKGLEVDRRDPLALSPRKQKITTHKFQIDDHFQSSRCLACGCPASEGICEDCQASPQSTIPNLLQRLRKGEKRLLDTHKICTSCTASASAEPIECMNTDCPWLYERKKAERRLDFLDGLRTLMDDFAESGNTSLIDVFL